MDKMPKCKASTKFGGCVEDHKTHPKVSRTIHAGNIIQNPRIQEIYNRIRISQSEHMEVMERGCFSSERRGY